MRAGQWRGRGGQWGAVGCRSLFISAPIHPTSRAPHLLTAQYWSPGTLSRGPENIPEKQWNFSAAGVWVRSWPGWKHNVHPCFLLLPL